MTTTRVDKNVCRYCKLSEPNVKMRRVYNEPVGECQACYRTRTQRYRIDKHIYSDFYSQNHNLNAANFKVLCALPVGAYPITYRASRKRIGFLVINDKHYVLSIFGQLNLYKVDLFGMSTFLANQNLILGADAMALLSPEGQPVTLEDTSKGLALEDVTDRLIMYDVKLREAAYKRVKAEIAKARASLSTFERLKMKEAEKKAKKDAKS